MVGQFMAAIALNKILLLCKEVNIYYEVKLDGKITLIFLIIGIKLIQLILNWRSEVKNTITKELIIIYKGPMAQLNQFTNLK